MSKGSLKIIAFFVIVFAVYGLWAGLELRLYGEVQPRVVDDVMGLILVFSLSKNFDHWLDSTGTHAG